MPRAYLATHVFEAAYDRLRKLYDVGERVVVSSSGGKDSTVVVELCIMAARDAGRLPVEVVMRDEEIMLPGTFEYLERLANRVDEVDFHWISMGQPITNVFNRFDPYFYVFDQLLDPDQWVRKWPGFDRGDGPETPRLLGRQPYWVDSQTIQSVCTIDRFPPLFAAEDWAAAVERATDAYDGEVHYTGRSRDRANPWVGIHTQLLSAPRDAVDPVTGVGYHDPKYCDRMPYSQYVAPGLAATPGRVWSLMGLRTAESPRRLMGLMAKGAWCTACVSQNGVIEATPIYDWQDTDVWKFIRDFKIDYNHAYDVMRRMGVPRQRLRIAPPTLTAAGLPQLQTAAKAWPQWFDRVADRLDGVRTAAQFGKRAILPHRMLGESWEQCFYREVVDPPHVPVWLKERALAVRDYALGAHSRHSNGPLPDAKGCPTCTTVKCWADVANGSYLGDPMSLKMTFLKPLEPEFFRPGAGEWGGAVAFA